MDFAVHDGIRQPDEQAALVRHGASQTLSSMHLEQPDGYGHAVDLVPYINGKLRWEWGPIYEIALAVREESLLLRTDIRWGGCWGLLSNAVDPRDAHAEYESRMRRAGRRPFADGPHFELRLTPP